MGNTLLKLLEWASGLIDGEGSIYVSKLRGGRSHVLKIAVGNTHLVALQTLKAVFQAGSICVNEITKTGKTVWKWTCASQQANTVIGMLSPHLIIKKEEAELALDFHRLLMATKNDLTDEVLAQREAYYWALKEAKTFK
jgi:hypothetical protein